jgi:hypothetical protein
LTSYMYIPLKRGHKCMNSPTTQTSPLQVTKIDEITPLTPTYMIATIRRREIHLESVKIASCAILTFLRWISLMLQKSRKIKRNRGHYLIFQSRLDPAVLINHGVCMCSLERGKLIDGLDGRGGCQRCVTLQSKGC